MTPTLNSNLQAQPLNRRRRAMLSEQSKPLNTPKKDEQQPKPSPNHKEPDPKNSKPQIQRWY
jgi:hypothetical protein